MTRWSARLAWLFLAVLFLAGCTSAPVEVADPLVYLQDRTNDPARRLAVLEQFEPIAETPDPEATAETLHRILWSDAQPTDLRLLAMDRLIGFDADDFWRIAQQNILRVDRWPVLQPLIEKAAQRSDPSFTTALVRSYTRPSQIIADSDRPERAAIEALHPGEAVERVVWGVLADPDTSVGLAARVDAWSLVNRLAGGDSARSMLMSESSSQPLVDALKSADWLGRLPDNREGVLWLMRLQDVHGGFWAEAAACEAQLNDEQRQGLELRHLPVILYARGRNLLSDRSGLVRRIADRIIVEDTVARSAAGNMRQLPDESFAAHAQGLCWADLLTIDMLQDAMSDHLLVTELFRQADADLADTSTEHGGVLVFEGARVVAESYLPVIRAHDQKFYSSDALIQRMYTGFLHYHFHAQKYSNAEYAGPGPGDLAFVENLKASAVVFTFLDRDTLGVDYYQPGGVVVDLGVVRR